MSVRSAARDFQAPEAAERQVRYWCVRALLCCGFAPRPPSTVTLSLTLNTFSWLLRSHAYSIWLCLHCQTFLRVQERRAHTDGFNSCLQLLAGLDHRVGCRPAGRLHELPGAVARAPHSLLAGLVSSTSGHDLCRGRCMPTAAAPYQGCPVVMT